MIGPIFIGVDGGGTGCRARIRDGEGRLLGEGTGGPANVRLGADVVWNSVLTACREAADQAGLTEAAFGAATVGLGLAGSSQEGMRQRVLMHPHPFSSITVVTDAHIAWLGAFQGRDGAILIVGTGSCGYAVAGGRSSFVGGWGHEVSDEGSGAFLGRELLRRAIWALDGRIAMTPLADAALAEFRHSPEAIVDHVGRAKPRDFARFAPTILDYARRRDALGTALVREAVEHIERMAHRLLDLGAPSLCLVGGLSQPLRSWLSPPLQDRLTTPLSDPLDGAILLLGQSATAAFSLHGDHDEA